MPTSTKFVLTERLMHLINYCEKQCVAECCGMDAFDFSPLHVASYLSAFTGSISPAEIGEWETELNKAAERTSQLSPDEDGYIGLLAGTNQFITRANLDALIAELRHSIQVSPQVLELSEQLRKNPLPAPQ